MPNLIVSSLNGQDISNKELYRILSNSGDNKNEPGLGRPFQKKPRPAFLLNAFIFDDKDQTVTVQNKAQLYAAAKVYLEGSNEVNANPQKAAILFSLLLNNYDQSAFDDKDYTQLALDQLNTFYKEGGPLFKKRMSDKQNILSLVQTRSIAHKSIKDSEAALKAQAEKAKQETIDAALKTQQEAEAAALEAKQEADNLAADLKKKSQETQNVPINVSDPVSSYLANQAKEDAQITSIGGLVDALQAGLTATETALEAQKKVKNLKTNPSTGLSLPLDRHDKAPEDDLESVESKEQDFDKKSTTDNATDKKPHLTKLIASMRSTEEQYTHSGLSTIKDAQKSLFISTDSNINLLNKLNLDELTELLRLSFNPEAEIFHAIRTEQGLFHQCAGGGNTQTLRDIQHAIKSAIIEKTKEMATSPFDLSQSKRYKLDADTYWSIKPLLAQHSGRFIGRWGRTASQKVFEETFEAEIKPSFSDTRTP